MDSRLESIGKSVDPLTLAVAIGLVAAVVWALSVLGNLPGRIASERGHPHASAISVCGWLGLLIIVLWPVALAWAYVMPRDEQGQTLSKEDVDALARDLDEAATQIAMLKASLAALSSSRRQLRPLDTGARGQTTKPGAGPSYDVLDSQRSGGAYTNN